MNNFEHMKRNRMDLIKAIEEAVMHCERCSAYEAVNGVEFSELYEFLEELKNNNKRFPFKSLPRLIDMLEPTAKAQKYCAKLIEQLKEEGYSTDAKIVNECLMTMQGEEIVMAVMDEATKKIDAEVAEYQAKVFAEKEQNKEQSEVGRFKEEFTKTKQL